MALVSFKPNGRLGNFFWTAATVYAYCLEHGLEFSVPKSTTNPTWSPIYMPHLVHPNYTEPFRPDITIHEKHFHYAPLEFQESWRGKNILFIGYFQAVPYIEKYREEIIQAFDLPWELQPLISLHARFGDYLSIPGKHVLVDEEYIKKAIDLMFDKTGICRVKVFSDDLNYFKRNFGHLYPFEYSTNTNEVGDLIEISCCHSNINSSSTFSFWGAYLNRNPDKVVVSQSRWFREGWRDNHGIVDTKNIIPDEWIKL